MVHFLTCYALAQLQPNNLIYFIEIGIAAAIALIFSKSGIRKFPCAMCIFL